MKWIAKYWPVLSGCALVVVFVAQSIWNTSAMRTELIHTVEDAKKDRQRLHAEDQILHKRVDLVRDKVYPLEKTMIRIETQQSAIQSGVDKLDKKMTRLLQRSTP
jgi:2C-methyl-D-erythritol 2,4-cyclodiphosphate synthase